MKPASIDVDQFPIRKINLDKITEPAERLRKLRDDKVKALAESMKEVGLINPITVKPGGSGFVVVAGVHRIRAARKLRWSSIKCWVKNDLDARRGQLIEIDENLMRADLAPEERSLHTQVRKQLWEERRGQSAHDAPFESKRADGKGHRPKGFAAETAAVTGRSKSQINRDLKLIDPETGKRVDPETGKPKPKRRSKDEIAKDNHEHALAVAEGFGMSATIEVARHAYLLACERLSYEEHRAEYLAIIDAMQKQVRKIVAKEGGAA